MAHASCINGHSLWNGDGTPCFAAYRFVNPNWRDTASKYVIYDGAFHLRQGRRIDIDACDNLDIWYCSECGSFFVFVSDCTVEKERFDYAPCEMESINDMNDLSSWDQYWVVHENGVEYEMIDDYTNGLVPLETLMDKCFKESYYLSPDKECIVKASRSGKALAAFHLVRHLYF